MRRPFLNRKASAYRAFFGSCRSSRCTASPRWAATCTGACAWAPTWSCSSWTSAKTATTSPATTILTPCADAEDEPRRFLGNRQKEWLKRQLRASGATWKLIGNQLMIMSLELAQGAQITKDSWDGYGVERREILDYVRGKSIGNVSFLTGDIHTFFAGDVGVNGRGPGSVATEFVGGSVTSLGIPELVAGTTGVPLTGEQSTLLTNNLLLTNPHIKYTQQTSRGYGVAEVDQDEMRVTFKGVNALDPNATARTIGRFRVASGSQRVQVL